MDVFLSEDPIWSVNLYPYADNNPVTNIDPFGTQAQSLSLEAKQQLLVKLLKRTQKETEKVIEKINSYTEKGSELVSLANDVASLTNSFEVASEVVSNATTFTSIANTTYNYFQCESDACRDVTMFSFGAEMGGETIGKLTGTDKTLHGLLTVKTVTAVASDSYTFYRYYQEGGFVDAINGLNKQGSWLYNGSQNIGNAFDSFNHWWYSGATSLFK